MKNFLIIIIILVVLVPKAAQAAISFVDSCSNNGNNGANATLTLPVGTAENDLVIVAYGNADADNLDLDMVMVTTGYTEVADLFSNDTTADANMGVYWKVMGAIPDTEAVADNIGGADTDTPAVCMVFRGVDTTTPMDVTPTTVQTLSTFHPNPPSINHNNPSGVWIVIAGANAHNLGATNTFTFPTGYTTDAIQIVGDDTIDGSVGLGYRSSGVSDPEDPGIMTHSGTDNAGFASVAATLALRPAIVNDPPTLTVDEPNGTGDTVTVGDSYSIQYDLADVEDTVTAAFFYDTDESGLNGTTITGACATAAEGTNATCSWNTTGVTPGSYFVYGVANDGTNPDVTDYSPGQITINAAVTAPTVTTNAETDVGVASATLNGEITNTGGETGAGTEHGFAWGTNPGLSGGDTSTTTLGTYSGTGTFPQTVFTLKEGTTYYFRAYATNSAGTGYGAIDNGFTTGTDSGVSRRIRLFNGFLIRLFNGKLTIFGQ